MRSSVASPSPLSPPLISSEKVLGGGESKRDTSSIRRPLFVIPPSISTIYTFATPLIVLLSHFSPFSVNPLHPPRHHTNFIDLSSRSPSYFGNCLFWKPACAPYSCSASAALAASLGLPWTCSDTTCLW